MKALFCGSRLWIDRKLIRQCIKLFPQGTLFVEGAARGADYITRVEAINAGYHVVEYAADWETGKKAGPIRNRRMLHEEHPQVVVAFHDDIAISKGTKDMLAAAKQENIPTFHISHLNYQVEIEKLRLEVEKLRSNLVASKSFNVTLSMNRLN